MTNQRVGLMLGDSQRQKVFHCAPSGVSLFSGQTEDEWVRKKINGTERRHYPECKSDSFIQTLHLNTDRYVCVCVHVCMAVCVSVCVCVCVSIFSSYPGLMTSSSTGCQWLEELLPDTDDPSHTYIHILQLHDASTCRLLWNESKGACMRVCDLDVQCCLPQDR